MKRIEILSFVVGAFLTMGCATVSARPNDPDTYFTILRQDLDWSLPELSAAKAALDSGDTETACAELLDHYRQRTEPQFFFRPEDVPLIARAIREDMPEEEAQLIDNADRIVARQFPNSTSRTVVYRVELPEDFSWTASPTEDPQFAYMLQRSRFWQDLAFGYALTGDERYAETFARQMASWLRDVPLPRNGWGKAGKPWWLTLNAGIRGDTWLWAYTLFLHSKAMTPELHAQILGALAEHARFLRARHKPPTGNWCVMEMQGLLNIAVLFPEFKEAPAWQDHARDMLVECTKNQIRPDGVQVEQSPSYHKGCIRWFLEPALLAERNGVAFPAAYRETLANMGEFAVWATDPQGRTVALSDSDRESETCMVLTSLAGAVNRPEFAWYRDVSHWHYWLFGVEGARQLRDMPKVAPKEETGTVPSEARSSVPRRDCPQVFRTPELMRVFPDAGYVFGRSDWSPEGRYFVFDCGPRGHGHGHLDLLNLEIHGFGDLLIADPGRWLYSDDPLRREIVATPAHNTLSLDGKSHATIEEPGGVIELVKTEQRDGWMYVHGRHSAYRNMAGPPVVERRIWFDGDAMWIVLDSVQAPERHTIRQTWQFAATGAIMEGLQATAKGTEGASVTIAVSDGPDQRAFIEESVVSPVYGSKRPADRFVVERRAAGAHMGAVIVASTEGVEVSPVSIALSESEGEVALTVRRGNESTELVVQKTLGTDPGLLRKPLGQSRVFNSEGTGD